MSNASRDSSNGPLIEVKRVGDGFKEVRIQQRKTTNKVYELCFTAKGRLAKLSDSELVNIVTEALAQGLLNGKLKLES